MFARIFCSRCARCTNGQSDEGHVRLEDSPVIQLDTCNMGNVISFMLCASLIMFNTVGFL